MVLHREFIHPVMFVRDSIQLFHVQAKSNGAELDYVPSAALSGNMIELIDKDEVLCDRFAVSQVIRNMVSNAIKFTPRGGRVSVHVCFEHIPLPPSPLFLLEHAEHNGIDLESGHSGNLNKEKENNTLSGFLRVSVTDSGVGISIEDQAKLFNGIVQFRPEVLI